MGVPIQRDFKQFYSLFTKDGAYTKTRDALDFQLAVNPGCRKSRSTRWPGTE